MPAFPVRRAAGPRFLAAAAALALAAGTAGCGSDSSEPAAPAQGAASLDAQAGRLLGGGTAAFNAQLARLKGTPVVVNQWASWCGPCRFEFPFFRTAAEKYQGRVAFLGVNSQDSSDAARAFLKRNPVPYPSFEDQSTAIARTFKGGRAWPTTAFYDASGRLVNVHPGGYATAAKLDEDIRAYAKPG